MRPKNENVDFIVYYQIHLLSTLLGNINIEVSAKGIISVGERT